MEANKEFQQYLDDSNYHLTDEAISNYINLHGIFDEKELEFINTHISGCPLCLDKYNKYFDNNFIDDEAIDIILLHYIKEELEENERSFINDDGTLKLLLKKDEEYYSIIILHLPAALSNVKAKITVPDLNIIFRLVNIHQNRLYKIEKTEDKEISLAKSILVESLKEEDHIIIPAERKQSFPIKNIIFIGGALIVVLILIFMLTKSGQNDEINNPVVIFDETEMPPADIDPIKKDTIEANQQLDTAAAVKPEEVPIADNFSQNYVLDSLIREPQSDLQMINPTFNETVSIPINFRWNDPLRASSYSLIIADNKNSRKYGSNIVGNSVTYSGSLKPGVYYWKIEVNGKLKGISRFIYR